jgi:hypothetical protein
MIISLGFFAQFATWGHAAVAALGALAHKVWSKLVGAEKAAAAEIEKLEAEIKAKV